MRSRRASVTGTGRQEFGMRTRSRRVDDEHRPCVCDTSLSGELCVTCAPSSLILITRVFTPLCPRRGRRDSYRVGRGSASDASGNLSVAPLPSPLLGQESFA